MRKVAVSNGVYNLVVANCALEVSINYMNRGYAYVKDGTTIIPTEQTERKCYGMELSLLYCDLEVKRREDFRGGKAMKVEGWHLWRYKKYLQKN